MACIHIPLPERTREPEIRVYTAVDERCQHHHVFFADRDQFNDMGGALQQGVYVFFYALLAVTEGLSVLCMTSAIGGMKRNSSARGSQVKTTQGCHPQTPAACSSV